MTNSYFFMRPLISPVHGWSAVDWQAGNPEVTESIDYVRCFTEADAASVANLLPMVVSINPEWLDQPGFVDGFEANQVIFVLPSDSLANPRIMARCQELKEQGFHFGIHVETAGIIRNVPLTAFDCLLFGAAFARHELPGTELVYASNAGFRKIALNVDSYEMSGWLADCGFELCDGHYLTARHPVFGKEPDLTRLKLLKLLNLVERDGDTHDIEEIFREEPKLSYNLLRLVNSVAVGARTRIRNFSQAIAILGRRQLQRWLQLLIYANNLSDGNGPHPLMQLAALRGRLMELLCKAIDPEPGKYDLSDNAFMTGMFSLLDVLINLPIAEILKELPLEDQVMNALKFPKQGGMLGDLLTVVVSVESGDFAAAEAVLSRLNISPEVYTRSEVAALLWTARINVEVQD